MSTLVNRTIPTAIIRVLCRYRYRDDDTTGLNLFDIRRVLDLWFAVADRIRR